MERAGRRLKEHAWDDPKSGRWGGWRLPVNIPVLVTLSSITLHPTQEVPCATPTSAT